MALSPMAALEGDFQIDDFLDPESDFARGVNLASERFADGEPGTFSLKVTSQTPGAGGDRRIEININSHGEGDPDQTPELQQAKWNFWG